MDKIQTFKKLEPIFDAFDKGRTFGSIEIIFRYGRVSVIRRMDTEKVTNEREKTRHEQHYETR